MLYNSSKLGYQKQEAKEDIATQPESLYSCLEVLIFNNYTVKMGLDGSFSSVQFVYIMFVSLMCSAPRSFDF